jgi:2-amino-4-hydroxy-6-hydroxymethyldihydropteridine diphosphokinase
MVRPPGIFLGLGSNLGDREQYLRRAGEELQREGVEVLESSSLYETEPVEAPPQDWFLNSVLRVETSLAPVALLDACLGIETRLGRVRVGFMSPRTLDIDLLLFRDEIHHAPSITVPHPRLHARRFVLVPLAELAPDARHPVLGRTMAELLARCQDTSRVLPRRIAVPPS